MTSYTLTIAPRSYEFSKVFNDIAFTSLAGGVQTTGRTGNRLSLSLVWARNRTDSMALEGYLASLHGQRNRAVIPLAKLGYVRGGVGGGTPLVSGAHAAGATTLMLKGLPSNTANILKPGDWLTVGNQLCQLSTALSTPGTTTSPNTPTIASCTIFPELHKAYADGTSVNYSTPSGTFICTGEGSGGINLDGLGTYSADFLMDVLA